MTDLTEKWKKGGLESGYYFFKTKDNIKIGFLYKKLKYPYDRRHSTIDDVEEVLAPVPSYDEWQTVFNYATKYEVEYVKCVNDYEKLRKENQQLRELLKECKPLFFPYVKDMPLSRCKALNLLTRINAAIGESEE